MTQPVASQKRITFGADVFEEYITAEEIRLRVEAIGNMLDRDFEGKIPILICVLNGAFMFFADLVRRIRIECQLDFIKLSSYGVNSSSNGTIELVTDVHCSVNGRHVILVEDIVDTGHTVAYLRNLMKTRGAASVSIVTLLHKPARTLIENQLEYVGFPVDPDFVIGYGLDYAQFGRNLPDIYIMRPEFASPRGIEQKNGHSG